MTRKTKTEEISDRQFSCFVEAVESHLGFLVTDFEFNKEYSRAYQEYLAKFTKASVTICCGGERWDLGGVGVEVLVGKTRKIRGRSLYGILGLRAPVQARSLAKMILDDNTIENGNRILSFEASCLRDFCPDLLHGRGDLIDCDSLTKVVDSMKDG